MTAVIVTAAIAPLMAEPSPRAELSSQLVLGEIATVAEERDAWLAVTRAEDGYRGWMHRGYVRRCDDDEAARWAARATFRAEDAALDVNGRRLALPLLARVAPSGERWELPSGQVGTVVAGKVTSAAALAEAAQRQHVVDWAIGHFSGTAYLWGGVTPWGVDCSGLVQSVYAARDIRLPRDSSEQEKLGTAVTADAAQPGDLYFFSESGTKVTHVALAGLGQDLVHSTLACGGFIVEPFVPGSRAWQLKPQLVSVKRL